MTLPHGWEAALDRLCASASSFDGSCFRSVKLEWAHPDAVISGKGVRRTGGRFARKGNRAVYASLDDETATREVTGKKVRLGRAIISFKDYPRITYVISVKAKKCVDFRNVGSDAVLNAILAAISDADLKPSQEVGDYLVRKGIDAVIYPSVTGSGANIAAFLGADPPAKVAIANRKKILDTLKKLGS